MSSTMTAVVYTGYGSPDVLQLNDVTKPVPADNKVLIKIHATTVETADAIFRQRRCRARAGLEQLHLTCA
jgi:NADPH:quinone reductase-like Zn-dependent oxidoreductase